MIAKPGSCFLRCLILFFVIVIFSDVLESTCFARPQEEDVTQIILPVTAAAIALARYDNEGFLQLSKGFASSITVTYALKYTVDRDRPDGSPHTFPSGHTASAFSAAAFLQKRYGWMYGLPAYSAAIFTGYGRVENGAHRTEDVLVGALLGIVGQLIFTTPYTNIKVVPLVGQTVGGIVATIEW